MTDAIALTISQQFEIEHMKRVVRETKDVEALQKLCIECFIAWEGQKAAAAWAFRQNLPPLSTKKNG
jgi:hypothetical protein